MIILFIRAKHGPGVVEHIDHLRLLNLMNLLLGQPDRFGLNIVERRAQVLRGGLEGESGFTVGLTEVRVELRVRRGWSDGHGVGGGSLMLCLVRAQEDIVCLVFIE